MQSLVSIGQEMWEEWGKGSLAVFAKKFNRRKWAWPMPKDAADSSESVCLTFWTVEDSVWEL